MKRKKQKRLISKTNFISCKIFNDYVLISRKVLQQIFKESAEKVAPLIGC